MTFDDAIAHDDDVDDDDAGCYYCDGLDCGVDCDDADYDVGDVGYHLIVVVVDDDVALAIGCVVVAVAGRCS